MEQVPLCQFTADLLKEPPLLLRLHPLCQRMDAHFPGNLGHGLHDMPVHAVPVIQMPQKIHVELDQIHVKPAEHIQRGITAAEVIQPDPEPKPPELSQLFMKASGHRSHVLLRDLHDEIYPVQRKIRAILSVDPVKLGGDVNVDNIIHMVMLYCSDLKIPLPNRGIQKAGFSQVA